MWASEAEKLYQETIPKFYSREFKNGATILVCKKCGVAPHDPILHYQWHGRVDSNVVED